MNVSSFEYLELIPELLNKIQDMEERLKRFMPKLTSKKEVIRFLGIADRTYYYYLEKGKLKEGIHFYKKDGKMHFVEDAIIELRDNRSKGRL